MNRMGLIKIPEGWRLLTFDEFMNIWNNHKEKFNFGGGNKFDEIIKQPLKALEKEYPYWNLWLARLDDGSDVNGSGRYLCYLTVRGVRFCREIEEVKK